MTITKYYIIDDIAKLATCMFDFHIQQDQKHTQLMKRGYSYIKIGLLKHKTDLNVVGDVYLIKCDYPFKLTRVLVVFDNLDEFYENMILALGCKHDFILDNKYIKVSHEIIYPTPDPEAKTFRSSTRVSELKVFLRQYFDTIKYKIDFKKMHSIY